MIRNINYLLIIICIVFSLGIAIQKDQTLVLVLKDISIIFTILIPYISQAIFNVKIDDKIKFIWILFIFFSQLIGVNLNVYNNIYFYDKIIHFTSGIISAYFSLFCLHLLNKYDCKNKLFNYIWMIIFTLSIAVLWEMFEYTSNILFKMDVQRVALTGVNDTMQDMISALLGSLILSIIYLFNHNITIFKFKNKIKKIY